LVCRFHFNLKKEKEKRKRVRRNSKGTENIEIVEKVKFGKAGAPMVTTDSA